MPVGVLNAGQPQEPTWGDYARTLGPIGGAGVAAAVPALTRYGASFSDSPEADAVALTSEYWSNVINHFREGQEQQLSPAAQQRLNAALTSSEFWEDPVSSIALQGTATLPSIAASVAAAVFSGGGLPALGAVGAAGGALSAGQTLDELYQGVDRKTDAELTQSVPYYQQLRAAGFSEQDARQALTEQMAGYKPLMLGALGALTSVAGPPGQIAGALGKAAGRQVVGGLAKRTAQEAGIGAGAEAIQTGAEAAVAEQAQVDIGQKPAVDVATVLEQGVRGGLLGGVFGGAAGALGGHAAPKVPGKAQPATPSTAPPVPITTPAPAPTTGTAAAQAPPATVTSGPSPRPRPKGGKKTTQTPVSGPTAPVAPVSTPAPSPTVSAEQLAAVAGTPPRVPASDTTQAGTRPQSPAQTGPVQAPAPLQTVAPTVPPSVVNVPTPKSPAPDQAAALATKAAEATPTPPTPEVAPPAAPVPRQRPIQPEPAQPVPAQPIPAAAPVAPAVSQPEPTPAAQPPAAAGVAPRTPSQVPEVVAPPTTVPVARGSDVVRRARQRQAAARAEKSPFAPETVAVPVEPEMVAEPSAFAPGTVAVGPRVLPDMSQAAQDTRIESQAAADEMAARIAETRKAEQQAGKSHESKAKQAERVEQANQAREVFDAHAPERSEMPRTRGDLQKLKARLDATLADAAERGVKVPVNVSNTTADHLMWLREVKDLRDNMAKAHFGDGFFAQDSAQKQHVTDFLTRELLARGGDFSVMRGERKAAGEAMARAYQGDVETMAAPAEAGEAPSEEEMAATRAGMEGASGHEEAAVERAAEHGEAPATPGKSARGAPRGLGEASSYEPGEQRAGAVRKVEITPEMRAKYEGLASLGTKPVTSQGKAKPLAKKGKEKVDEIKAKQKAGKTKVTEEAGKVDRARSEAQAQADNYAQGHPGVLGGNRITIKASRGDEYRGQDANGRRWTVQLKHHIGKLLGTEDANGKPVEVVLGPKAWPGNRELDDMRVFVIDQLDPTTGQLAGHKAMLGFDDARSAMDAFMAATPDNDPNRYGDLRMMSPSEFKTWKQGDTSEPVAGRPVAGEEPEIDPRLAVRLRSPEEAIPVSEFGTGMFGETARRWLEMQRVRPRTFGDVRELLLAAIDQTPELPKFVRAAVPQLLNRLGKYIEDMPVYMVNERELSRLSGEYDSNEHPTAYYDSAGHYIVLGPKVWGVAANRELASHVVLHEVVHAAFVKALLHNPAARQAIDGIARELRDALHGMGDLASQYAFLNPDEFIAEAFSNPTMAARMAQISASPKLRKLMADRRLGLIGRNIRSLWDAFRSTIAGALGIESRTENTLLDAILQVGGELDVQMQGTRAGALSPAELDLRVEQEAQLFDFDSPWLGDTWEGDTFPSRLAFRERKPVREQVGSPWVMRLRGIDALAQLAKDYGKPFYDVVRAVADRIEMRRVSAMRIFREAEPLLNRALDLEKRYSGADWKSFVDLAHDATNANVHPDRALAAQPHLGKQSLAGAWSRAQHAELAARYDALPQQLQDFFQDATSFFRDRQNRMSFGIIRNMLSVAGIEDDSLAVRIFNNSASDADRERVGKELFDRIDAASELKEIKGPYFPMMRRGRFVVRGRLNVPEPPSVPGGVDRIDESTFEFKGQDARKRALAYAQSPALRGIHSELKSIWVDSQTGLRHFLDEDGKEVRVTPQDTDAEQRFRVSVQNRHVEFFDTERLARERAAELEGRGFTDVQHAERRPEMSGQMDMTQDSARLRGLMSALEKRPGFHELSETQQHELRQAMSEASLRFLGSTRVQSHRLPRRHVLGASRDVTQNLTEYAISTSNYLARLEHAPELNKAVAEMRNVVDKDTSDYGKTVSSGRSRIANEIERRMVGADAFQPRGGWHDRIQRAATVSSLAHLASPARSIVNSLQTAMVTYPTLAARYGPGRAASLLYQAYRDVGAGRLLRAGLRETGTQIRHPHTQPKDFFADVIGSTRNADERAMLNYLHDRGSLGLDAGLEVARLIEASRAGFSGKADTSLAYLSGIARALPSMVETLNRTTSALAAYRGEKARTGSHEQAMRHAQETVNLTHGLYSHTDAPKIFSHPVGQLAFQFKRFGHLMYQMLGHYAGKAIRNANPGDRAEAIKALTMLAGTHIAMAGMLGLPTEPIKGLVVAFGALGLPFNWEDAEAYARELASGALGQTGGELLMRGLPRAAGIDLSSRVGLADLMTFGEPDSFSQDDVFSYLGSMFTGAAAGTAFDMTAGFRKMVGGEVAEGLQDMVPIKAVKDAVKAYRYATEGKKTPAGYQAMEPYSAFETAVRGLGFTPSREAEAGELRAQMDRQEGQVRNARSKFQRRWVEASPDERARLWGEIERYNRGVSREQRLTRADLDNYKKRRAREETSRGFRINRRNRGLLQELEGVYNVQ